MNDLKWRNWNEWIEMTAFTWMNWNKWQSRAPFPDLIFQKCSERDRDYVVYVKPSSHYSTLQSCALFVDNFPRSTSAPAETETLLRRPRKPLYPKKHKVSRPRVFSNLNSRVPDLLRFPTTWQLLDDDVVDIIMWLTWWACCLWQPSVPRKFPN